MTKLTSCGRWVCPVFLSQFFGHALPPSATAAHRPVSSSVTVSGGVRHCTLLDPARCTALPPSSPSLPSHHVQVCEQRALQACAGGRGGFLSGGRQQRRRAAEHCIIPCLQQSQQLPLFLASHACMHLSICVNSYSYKTLY